MAESSAEARAAQDVEIEAESQTSVDSALGSDADSTESASVTSSIYGYKYENGRRYHAYREGSYLLPNDDEEQDRLDLHHHIFRLILGGSLARAPIPEDVGRVLDFGTGTGIWAIDFADERPNSTVVGTDLSPIQPDWLPPNVKFYVDDVESAWTWTLPAEAFDYVHGRGMGGAVTDWSLLFNRVFEHLNPGGWFEMQEYAAEITSEDDPELKKAPHVKKWQDLINQAARKFGKELDIASKMEGYFHRAGFEEVREVVIKVPIGPWAKDPRLKEIGRFQRENMIACIPAFTLAPFRRVLGWEVEEIEVLMANLRNEFRNPRAHMITTFYFVYGRKPLH